MNLGERISPFSISNIRGVPLDIEPLRDARTMLAVFFSILSSGERSRRADSQTSGFSVFILDGAERGSTCRVCAELQ